MRRLFIIFVMIAVLSMNAFGATIYGTIYDLSLKKVNNVRVEVDTSPKQFVIAQNGTYSFNVPYGSYLIKARLLEKNELVASVEENITVKQDGAYVKDLILFPNVEQGVDDIEVPVPDDLIVNEMKTNYRVFIAVFLALVVILYLASKKRNNRKRIEAENKAETANNEISDQDLDKIIEIIKRENGRTTQKDIRKEIPLSEAKISLMIAELEHKGIVEKIKKGRGNIIILKKK